MTEKKKKESRTRNFATVVYPESAPVNWMERLEEYHIAAFVSPLHDRDVNPNGELKKPHYHVMLTFEGPKEFETQVKPIFDDIGGVGREIVNSTRGYARYLCHLDNPEKAQYSPSEVRCMAGADYDSVTNLPSDDRKLLGEMLVYIREQEIYSFAEFLDICQMSHPDWYSLVLSKSWTIREYIKSLAWERERRYVRVTDRQSGVCECDPETGEVLLWCVR